MTGADRPSGEPASEPPPLSAPWDDAAAGAPETARGSPLRGRAKWLLASLLALDVGVLLFALSFANATAEGPAKRSLGYSLAILTEVDAYLDLHFEALQEAASETDAEVVTAPDFPVAVTFTPEEILAADRAALRRLLLERSAERVHEQGARVLREDRTVEIGFFSPQGAIRAGMDFLRPAPHQVLTVLTMSLAAAAGVLALGLVVTARGYGRLLSVGLSVFAAAVPFLVVAVGVRFALRVAADGTDDYLAREFLRLCQEVSWAPIRNGLIFSAGSAAFVAAGTALARWSDSRLPP